jgi:nucleoside 2-deoxyribosyltransferase
MKIYLAGGMYSNWQDKVKIEANNHSYYDPRTHGLNNPIEFTKWDLDHVKKSDLVFAFFESTHRVFCGGTLELGYAKELNKKIILTVDRYNTLVRMPMSVAIADMDFFDLYESIKYLKRIEYDSELV